MRHAATVALATTLFALPAVGSELNMPPGGAPAEGPVEFVFVGEPPNGLDTEDVQVALQDGAAEWSAVACSPLRVSALEPVASLAELPADAVPVLFVDIGTDCFPDRGGESQAIGFTVYCDAYPGPTILLNRQSYTWSVDPVPFQSIDQPEVGPVVDLRSVIVHEMGHALRLGHSDDPIAAMYATYRRDGSQASLSAADDLALCELYPGGQSECADDADCGGRSTCVANQTYAACDSFRGETGEFCSWEVLQCGGECFFSSPATGTGYCTADCVSNADCPDQMECRATSNGSSLCQFEFGEAEPSCSTLGGPAGMLPGLLVLSLFTLRRRWRR